MAKKNVVLREFMDETGLTQMEAESLIWKDCNMTTKKAITRSAVCMKGTGKVVSLSDRAMAILIERFMVRIPGRRKIF